MRTFVFFLALASLAACAEGIPAAGAEDEAGDGGAGGSGGNAGQAGESSTAGAGGGTAGAGAGGAGGSEGGGKGGAATGGKGGSGTSGTGGAGAAGMGGATSGAAGTGGSTSAGAAGTGGSTSAGAAGTGGSTSAGAAGTGGSTSAGAAGTGGSATAGAAGNGGGGASGGAGGGAGAGGSPAGCALPGDACGSVTGTKVGCIGAQIIGRSEAKQAGGYAAKNQSTCNGADHMNTGKCNVDAGYDHTYRIFLRAGEQLSVSVTSNACFLGSSSARIKVYQANTGCLAPTGTACDDGGLVVTCTSSSAKVTASAEGWFVVVVDGDTPGDGIEYSLTVKLDPASCATAGCECP